MVNMSYVRYENTYQALLECYQSMLDLNYDGDYNYNDNDLDDAGDNDDLVRFKPVELSNSEKHYKDMLIELCDQFIKLNKNEI